VLRKRCAMKLSRINRGGVDGPVPRLVVVKPDEGRVVDLVSAEKLRLMRKGATSAGALLRASGLFPGSMAQAISTGSAFLESAAETVAATGDDASIEFSNVEWIAAVDPPMLRDCFAFVAHLEAYYRGVGQEISPVHYRQPGYYKGTNARCFGHEARIPWPHYSDFVDYECEIGFVVGRECHNVDPDEAGKAIFGLTIFNDYSARDCQTDELTMSMGPTKCKDFANGIGPWVTTIDEFDDLSALEMTVRINDKECGRGISSGMQWLPEELLAYISQGDVVQPGDVFGSGTVGNGCGLESGVRVKPGDVIALEISGIGVLRQVLGQKEERGWRPIPRERNVI
jgi:2-keto-4-pentenoate hydratase/2-oxohepta-3-ene-1,7-dioic acid hydratase in catechol pathway